MPRIIFLRDCTLCVCRSEDSYYHREPPVYVDKQVKEGACHSVRFLEGVHDPEKDCFLDVQFEDGSVAVSLPNYLFDLAEDSN